MVSVWAEKAEADMGKAIRLSAAIICFPGRFVKIDRGEANAYRMNK